MFYVVSAATIVAVLCGVVQAVVGIQFIVLVCLNQVELLKLKQ